MTKVHNYTTEWIGRTTIFGNVVYLRIFFITKYGSPTNPFGNMFEEFCHYKCGSPTNLFGRIFEECCHNKMW